MSIRSRPAKYLPTVYMNLFPLEFPGGMVVFIGKKRNYLRKQLSRDDDGLTLETSTLKPFTVATLRYQLG